MSFDSHILSLRTLFRGPARDMRVQLFLDEQPFAAVIERGDFSIERGELEDADATIEGEAGALIGVAHGRVPFEESGLDIEGDADAARRFLTLFPLPDPIPA
jgi:hypothetical protein